MWFSSSVADVFNVFESMRRCLQSVLCKFKIKRGTLKRETWMIRYQFSNQLDWHRWLANEDQLLRCLRLVNEDGKSCRLNLQFREDRRKRQNRSIKNLKRLSAITSVMKSSPNHFPSSWTRRQKDSSGAIRSSLPSSILDWRDSAEWFTIFLFLLSWRWNS